MNTNLNQSREKLINSMPGIFSAAKISIPGADMLTQENYTDTLNKMRSKTIERIKAKKAGLHDSPDEIWFLEHEPVFTLGKFGDKSHILNPGDIPTVETDRGGQVTYHGPGQLMVYILMDLKRAKIGPKKLVCLLEKWVIDWLASYDIKAHRISGKPGVYVNNAKIAAIGVRIKHGFTYHGMAINIDMDLEPFSRINPCGYEHQKVTTLKLEDSSF